MSNPTHTPPHHEPFPLQPIAITRHLGFCLGSAVKHVLQAPHRGGIRGLDNALNYMRWECETPSSLPSMPVYAEIDRALHTLTADEPASKLLRHELQMVFLLELDRYLRTGDTEKLIGLEGIIRELRAALERKPE